MLSCCCCGCTQLDEWAGLQLGTIDGYTPAGHWQKINSGGVCAYTRTFNRNSYVCHYECLDTCQATDLGGGLYYHDFELEACPGSSIQLLLVRYRYGDALFPACDPDNNQETAFNGCKYVLMSRYIDRAVFAYAIRVGAAPPCPTIIADLRRYRITYDVIWNRISKPSSSLPSGIYNFDSQSVSTCYCDPSNNPTPSCDYGTGNYWYPFNFDTEDQCLSSEDVFTLLGNPYCETSPQHIEYCFSPPSWTVTI
jgi:hypothetical protein